MSLQVKIKKKFEDFCLDVDFSTDMGIFAILGASGCGKSMTLKCIAGIETPDEGKIVLNGKTLFDSEKRINLPPQKRHVGYMFQDYALFPNMTVQKNIMAGMGRKPDKNLVEDYIKRFHLEGLEKRYPHELSGGQKQRTAMARMIAAQPEILLLDEPFSALDSSLKWELEQQMRGLLKEIGKPALFVSHNRDEVYRICQMVGCMNQGKMETPRPVKEFFNNPETITAAILSGCKNISRAHRVDDTHVFAEEWKVMLEVPFVPDNLGAVGIRAHSFKKCEKEQEINIFFINQYEILEDMFEWNLSFKVSPEGKSIQWKFPKGEEEMKLKKLPDRLTVQMRDILILKK